MIFQDYASFLCVALCLKHSILEIIAYIIRLYGLSSLSVIFVSTIFGSLFLHIHTAHTDSMYNKEKKKREWRARERDAMHCAQAVYTRMNILYVRYDEYVNKHICCVFYI